MGFERFGIDNAVNRDSTVVYSCKFLDLSGNGLALASVIMLTARIEDVVTGTATFDGSVLNVNTGSVAGILVDGGDFELVIQPDLLPQYFNWQPLKYRLWRLTLFLSFQDGQLTHDVLFYVRNEYDLNVIVGP